MISIENLSDISKKLLYIQNVRPLLRKEALFSDGTEDYVIPPQPGIGEEVKIRFRTAKANADSVYLCSNGKRAEMKLEKRTELFDYYQISCVPDEEKFYYYFEIINRFEHCFYNKLGCSNEIQKEYDFCIVPGFHTPDWAKGAVIYQIFTDRFYNGDKTNDVLDREYSYIDDYSVQVKEWNKYPAAMGVREFYGGDLQGVLDKMDYLEKLGIQAIYFNPLFVSPSNHKYDIQDYDNIDPHYGVITEDEGELLPEGEKSNIKASRYISRVTRKENLDASNALFAKLVEEAHRRGIRVIIDGVFNHCGSFNKWLDKEKIYQGREGYQDGAYISKDSPYHSFFHFYENEDRKWPDNGSYDGWWGHDTLPKLNYEGSKELEEYILNVAKKWVSPPYNADGWRLDVAADLGKTPEYNHEFWRKFRKVVKEANPEAIILAEHYGDPSSWLQGDQWDTVMNYDAFMEPVTWFLTGMEKHSDEKNESMRGNANSFFGTMRYNMAKFHTPSLMVAMNELSNHDHSRFLTRTNGRVGRTSSCGPEEANKGISRAVMKEAVVMQMTWPGAPTIYYGDEAGVCGWTDPDHRRTYPWGHEDMDLLEFHRDMIQMHKRNPALAKGSLIPLHAEYNLIAYARTCQENKLVIIINNNDEDREISIKVYPAGISYEAETARIVETAEEWYNVGRLPVDLENGELHVVMKRKSAAVYDCSGSEPVIFCETTH